MLEQELYSEGRVQSSMTLLGPYRNKLVRKSYFEDARLRRKSPIAPNPKMAREAGSGIEFDVATKAIPSNAKSLPLPGKPTSWPASKISIGCSAASRFEPTIEPGPGFCLHFAIKFVRARIELTLVPVGCVGLGEDLRHHSVSPLHLR